MGSRRSWATSPTSPASTSSSRAAASTSSSARRSPARRRLMRLMAGLERADRRAGSMRRRGRHRPVASGNAAWRWSISSSSTTRPSRVYDNIASPLRLAGLDRHAIDRRVRATAKLLRIDHLLDRLPAALSGGQQQRCAIARALVKEARASAPRRAAGQSRLQAPRGAADRAEGSCSRRRDHGRLRHHRAAGGAGHGRPGHRAARGPRCCSRGRTLEVYHRPNSAAGGRWSSATRR